MVTRERAVPGGLGAIEIAFDDERLVADAGLVLPATLCERLGAEGVIDGLVERPGDPAIGVAAGAKALSVAFAMLAGADSIDDVERLRAGASGAVLGLRPRAATTCGNWLRGLGFGQVRQLDASCGELARRAWGAGARPERLVIDLDSSITPVHGHHKRGATATPGCSATTQSSPPRPRRARSSTPACARGRPTRSTGARASSARRSRAAGGPAMRERFSCGPTPAS